MKRRLAMLLPGLLLAACGSLGSPPAGLTADTAILLLGEQHDEPGHHALEREMVQALAGRGVLAALVLEMAQDGASTAGLPADASEEQVRRSLRWPADGSWPWADYAPAVMAAVANGIPAVGADLPRASVPSAMADASLDARLPGPAIKAQQQAIRSGHCGLLPEQRVQPMTRVQIARDRTIAATLMRWVEPGKTVLLITGARHADPAIGVPQHLPPGLVVRSVELPPPLTPRRDYCAQLRRDWKGRPGPTMDPAGLQ
jgi:uncharacterized iron-regulated protein